MKRYYITVKRYERTQIICQEYMSDSVGYHGNCLVNNFILKSREDIETNSLDNESIVFISEAEVAQVKAFLDIKDWYNPCKDTVSGKEFKAWQDVINSAEAGSIEFHEVSFKI